jgi:hypothetical protein
VAATETMIREATSYAEENIEGAIDEAMATMTGRGGRRLRL